MKDSVCTRFREGQADEGECGNRHGGANGEVEIRAMSGDVAVDSLRGELAEETIEEADRNTHSRAIFEAIGYESVVDHLCSGGASLRACSGWVATDRMEGM